MNIEPVEKFSLDFKVKDTKTYRKSETGSRDFLMTRTESVLFNHLLKKAGYISAPKMLVVRLRIIVAQWKHWMKDLQKQ